MATHDRIEGNLNNCVYEINIPKQWKGKLILFAHGYRPNELPLTARLEELRGGQDLVNLGWLVAITSFRRNGVIIKDAIQDILDLKKHVQENYGEPEITILIGSSMGGCICAQIAENPTGKGIHAVLGCGAALFSQFLLSQEKVDYTYDPLIPSLYLSNQDEIQDPKEYVNKAKNAVYPPKFWVVKRDGHVNLNGSEIVSAVNALVNWMENDNAPENERDATIVPKPRPSTIEFANDNRSGTGKLIRMDEYGNCMSDFQPADLQKLGLEIGNKLSLSCNNYTHSAVLGKNYNSVNVGEWVVFENCDGNFTICRNFASAAQSFNILNYGSFPISITISIHQ